MSKTKMSKKEMEAMAFRNAAIKKMYETDKRLDNLEKSSTTKKKKKKKSGTKITGLGKILGKLQTLQTTYKPFK